MTTPGLGPTPQPRRASYGLRLAFMGYLIAELVVVYLVWQALGSIGWTLLLLAATTALGAVLVGSIGTKAIREYQRAVVAEEPPGPAAVSGTIGVVGAILLILPGFLSDIVGALCVFPPTRFLWRSVVTKFLHRRLDSPTAARFFGARRVRPEWGQPRRESGTSSAEAADDEVIEGEVIDPEPQQPPRQRRVDPNS